MPSTLPPTAPGLQAHALADPERPGAQENQTGDQVAERLLGRETDDDGGEGASGHERGWRSARATLEGEQQRDAERGQADDEANRSRGRRIHAAEERGRSRLADVAGNRPTQR